MRDVANRVWLFASLRCALLANVSCGLASLLARPAAATVCSTSCVPYECGFEIADIRCAVVPANYQLEVAVDCSGAIGVDALPSLVLAGGTPLASEWRPLDRLWGSPEYWLSSIEQPRNVYVRVGPTLPENAVVSVVHRVPERCAIVSIHACNSSAHVACAEGTGSCCDAFDAARIPFAADGVVDQGFAQTSTGGAGAGSPINGMHEYTRFRTTVADNVAPPALSVELECQLDESSPTRPLVMIHHKLSTPSGETPDLTDVAEAAIFKLVPGALVPRSEVVYRAPVCGPASPPSSPFELSGLHFTSLITAPIAPTMSLQWSYFVRTYDAAGNVSEGPLTTLTIPDGCTHDFTPREPSPPLRLCPAPTSPSTCDASVASAGTAGVSNAPGSAGASASAGTGQAGGTAGAGAAPSSSSTSPLNSGGRPNLDAVCGLSAPSYFPVIPGQPDPRSAGGSGGATTYVFAQPHTSSSNCSLAESSNGTGPWGLAGLALVALRVRRRTRCTSS